MTSARTQRGEPGISLQYCLSVPICREQEHHRPGNRHQGSARTVRLVQPAEEPTESAAKRSPVEEAPVEEARGVRSQGTRESPDFLEVVGDSKVSQVNASTAFFI